MKKFLFINAICLALFIAGSTSQSEAQQSTGYTFLRGPMGPQVCVGRYTPPTPDAVSGVCEGQVLDLGQFNAISSRQSSERLDQVIQVLLAIDNKLAQNNERMDRLIETNASAQAMANRQDRELGELRDAIERRFESMPEELQSEEAFKREIGKLKDDILKEVEKRYQPRPAGPVKTPPPAK